MVISDSSFFLVQFFTVFAPLFGACALVYLSVLVVRRIIHV